MKKLIALISPQGKTSQQLYQEIKQALKKFNRVQKRVLQKLNKVQPAQNASLNSVKSNNYKS